MNAHAFVDGVRTENLKLYPCLLVILTGTKFHMLDRAGQETLGPVAVHGVFFSVDGETELILRC
jgi:hypothetical protein